MPEMEKGQSRLLEQERGEKAERARWEGCWGENRLVKADWHSFLKVLSFQMKAVVFACQNRKEKIPPEGFQSYPAYAFLFLEISIVNTKIRYSLSQLPVFNFLVVAIPLNVFLLT